MGHRAAILSVLVAVAACTGTAPSSRPALLIDVVDGDTLAVSLDGSVQRVRLAGINAPEIGECFAQEATVGLERLVVGAELRLSAAGVGETDRFGRLLRYVTADGVLVNEALVSSGHALSLADGHDLAADFDSAQSSARSSRLGLWGREACGPEVDVRVTIHDFEEDPPGDDNEFPNGEYVAITNGGDAVDVGGWILRDESSTHRYVFSVGTVIGRGGSITVYSGCGRDTDVAVYWCAGPVWSNGGDSVILQAASGNVVDAVVYRG